jgi:hypothetical protein
LTIGSMQPFTIMAGASASDSLRLMRSKDLLGADLVLVRDPLLDCRRADESRLIWSVLLP